MAWAGLPEEFRKDLTRENCMRFSIRHVLVLAVALAGVARSAASQTAAQPVDSRAADARAIRAHIDSIFKAYMQKDRAAIIATHARDWRGFLTSSRTILRGIDDYMAQADPDLKSDWRMTAYRFVDYDTVFRGDIAIINYIADIDGEWHGQPTKGTRLRVIDIYEKSDGQWNQIASNTSLHPDSVDAQVKAASASCKP
jgi:ketosteroid isomerase-like protein